jgi:hypothetical protein
MFMNSSKAPSLRGKDEAIALRPAFRAGTTGGRLRFPSIVQRSRRNTARSLAGQSRRLSPLALLALSRIPPGAYN